MIARCPACSELFPALGSTRSSCPFCGAALEVIIQRFPPAPIEWGRGEPTPGPHGSRPSPEVRPEAGGARPPAGTRRLATSISDRPGTALGRFGRNLRAVLAGPRQFFRAPLDEGIAGSILFAILTVIPPLLVNVSVVWALALHPLGRSLSVAHWIDSSAPERLPRLLVTLPLAAPLFVAYLAAFYQAAIALASRRRPALSQTIRGTCFGFAPMIIAVVPIVGLAIGLVWSLVLHAIALREIHGLGRLQATAVVAMPQLLLALHLAYA